VAGYPPPEAVTGKAREATGLSPPATVTGRDGKQYSARQRIVGEDIDADEKTVRKARADWSAPEIV
jgi:hypothetical protein